MGREIKRVPVDFDWPLNKKWEGFLIPKELVDWPPCPDCTIDEGYSDRHGDGLTPEARAIDKTFYCLHLPNGPVREMYRWDNKIGQVEVDNLIEKGRLRTWIPGINGERGTWESLPRTAAEVNSSQGSMLNGHDAINRGILLRFRCEQLGITLYCPTCKGHGDIATQEERDRADAWVATEPPEGEGWQIWETVSEGSPITPVFPTAEALIEHLVTVGDGWDGPFSRETAEKFVHGSGWVPSMVMQGGVLKSGIETVDLQ